MKILLGGNEVCGFLKTYQNEFEKLGHQVASAIYTPDVYFPHYNYDFYLNDYGLKIKPSIFGKEITILKKIFNKIKQYRIKKQFVEREAIKYDLIIFIWRSFLNDNSDLPFLNKNGSKIVFLFLGSEVRYNNFFLRKYDMQGLNLNFLLNHPLTLTKIENRLKFVRTIEKYSHLIYSAPDMDGLQKRPYYHVPAVMNISKYPFKNNYRKTPVVIHAPSQPGKKGTDVIETTLNKLKNEGVKFEYLRLENIPNNKVIDFLMDGDILVDELIFHGPGILAFEAMLCGCAVATRHLAEFSHIFGPPVVNITVQNIYDQVKRLIVDYDLRQQYIIKGREYSEKNNDAHTIAKKMLENIKNPRKPDYFPETELAYFDEDEKSILSNFDY